MIRVFKASTTRKAYAEALERLGITEENRAAEDDLRIAEWFGYQPWPEDIEQHIEIDFWDGDVVIEAWAELTEEDIFYEFKRAFAQDGHLDLGEEGDVYDISPIYPEDTYDGCLYLTGKTEDEKPVDVVLELYDNYDDSSDENGFHIDSWEVLEIEIKEEA